MTPELQAKLDEQHRIATLIRLELTYVESEVMRAMGLHGPLRGHHEAIAVIAEELAEYWEEVRKRSPDRATLRRELVEVAAMAVRALYDLEPAPHG